MNTARATIKRFLQDYIGSNTAVVGLSGGIDSTVVAYLLVEALGPDQVYGLVLPSHTTAKADITDAIEVANTLGIHHVVVNISPVVETFQGQVDFLDSGMTAGNVQARVRMTLLYGKANSVGGLVVGTGNKTELEIGYFTKYGDGGVDLLPIGALYKKDVWALAKELGVPSAIIEKAPTAGLFDGQTDEAELGISYQDLDAILEAMNAGAEPSGFSEDQITLVNQLRTAAKHKLVMPPIAPVPEHE